MLEWHIVVIIAIYGSHKTEQYLVQEHCFGFSQKGWAHGRTICCAHSLYESSE